MNSVKSTGYRVKKILAWCLLIAVIALLVLYTKKVNWKQVYQVIRDYNHFVIAGAAVLALISYLIYGVYDLIGRSCCGHLLSKTQVMLVSFICYAINLTLGTWVGGIAMRYHLYSRLGLSANTITHIFTLSIITNWLGYLLLAGIIFICDLTPLPNSWLISDNMLRFIGVLLLVCAGIYFWLCAFSRRRYWTIKGQTLVLPSLRIALLQLAISTINWLVIGMILWLLLSGEADYTIVLSVLLISSVAAVIVHLPAGIGVLEAVFLVLLKGQHATHDAIIAALIAYRMLYFILPLLLALLLYLWLSSWIKTRRPKKPPQAINGR